MKKRKDSELTQAQRREAYLVAIQEHRAAAAEFKRRGKYKDALDHDTAIAGLLRKAMQ